MEDLKSCSRVKKYVGMLNNVISEEEEKRILKDSILEQIVLFPNASGEEIARKLGIKKDQFYGYLYRNEIFSKIYQAFREERKERELIEKAENAIVENPPGTSIHAIGRKYHFGFQKVLSRNPKLRLFFESIHGRKRVDSKTGIKKDIIWMKALKATVDAPKYSTKYEIARLAGIPERTYRTYASNDSLLGKVYSAFHGNGVFAIKEQKVMKAFLESPPGTSIKKMNREYKTGVQTLIKRNKIFEKLYYYLHKKVILERSKRKTKVKGLDYYKIKETIDKVPKYSTISYIAKILGVGHNAIHYHLKLMPPKGEPYLMDYYQQMHGNSEKDNKLRERVKGVVMTIRTNSTKKDIAEELPDISPSKVYSLLKEEELNNTYNKYHPGNKMSKVIFEKINKSINKSPPGTPMTDISRKYKISLSNYISVPWVSKLYESRHGKIKTGRHKH